MTEIGKTYRHYKGVLYKVTELAKHSETEEDMVVYQDVTHPEKVWVRPQGMFEELVEVGGKTMPRFTLIS